MHLKNHLLISSVKGAQESSEIYRLQYDDG